MREISPAEDLSADDFVRLLPESLKKVVERIRSEKQSGAPVAFYPVVEQFADAQRRKASTPYR
jgi:hypothetical protein